MWLESDDESAVTFGAESARIARNASDPLRRANHNFVSGRRSEPIRAVLRNHSRDGQAGFCERIGMRDGVRRKVYHETVAISGTDPPQICDGCRLMRIRETAPAGVSFGKLRQSHTVNRVAITGKITGLVVTP